jgi:hypothetical protein
MADTDIDLYSYRAFNPHTWSDSPAVQELVDIIWADHLAVEFDKTLDGRGRPATVPPKDQFKILVLELYLCWRENSEQFLSIYKQDSMYRRNSRYRSSRVTKKIVDILNAMRKSGLIRECTGERSKERLQITRIKPTESLVAYFKEVPFQDKEIIQNFDKETVILRDENKVDIDYVDQSERGATTATDKIVAPTVVTRMRQELKAYNTLLSKSFIDIGTLEHPSVETFKIDEKGNKIRRNTQITQNRKFVRRIFNKGSFFHGGRFYGGWWQQIGSELRKSIRINDQATVERDYSGIHIALAYALQGHPPPRDAYRLDTVFDEYKGDADRQRKDVKSLALIAINAATRQKALNAFTGTINSQVRHGERPPIEMDNSLAERLLDGFLDKNPLLSEDMGTGAGLALQRIDSDITSKIIKHFTGKGIVVLAIHDSYIIETQYHEELAQVMEQSFRDSLDGITPCAKDEKFTQFSVSEISSDDIEGKRAGIDQFFRDLKTSINTTEGYRSRLNDWLKNYQSRNNL